MKRLFPSLLFVGVGLALLFASYTWCKRELNLRLHGQPAAGRIVGMALTRPTHTDLLTGIDTRLVLTLADGTRVVADYRDHVLQAPPSADLAGKLAPVLSDAVGGQADIVRWTLLRESRRPDDPHRVVRIEKTETIHGYFNLPKLPPLLGWRDGRLVLDPLPAGSQAGTVRIHGDFDYRNPASVKANKGDSLVAYDYQRLGASFTPEKRNFFLFAEPYATQFRPVFAFTANGQAVARLSHVGRHGGPTLALRLFGECRVYYDPRNPTEAVLLAHIGPGQGEWLAWFSRLCEGIFAQWGSAALIALAGLLFIGTGLLFLSLLLFPSKHLPAQAATPP
jgi:hypothetical protein